MVATIRVVVVDDHALFRRGLVGLLSEMPGVEIVGEAENGSAVPELVSRTRPDIVLMDVNMPVVDGVGAVRAIRQARLKVKILMLTISQDEDDLVNAIVAGADGYLLKNAEPEVLHQTIEKITAGRSVLSPEMTDKVFNALRNEQRVTQANLLSEREMEVLVCLAQGLTTRQIAAELFISENTVKTHIRHILEKMDVNNRAEAVAQAAQLGLI